MVIVKREPSRSPNIEWCQFEERPGPAPPSRRAAKKHSLKIESTKTEAGDRVYRSRSRDSGSESGLRPLTCEGGGFFAATPFAFSSFHRQLGGGPAERNAGRYLVISVALVAIRACFRVRCRSTRTSTDGPPDHQ